MSRTPALKTALDLREKEFKRLRRASPASRPRSCSGCRHWRHCPDRCGASQCRALRVWHVVHIRHVVQVRFQPAHRWIDLSHCGDRRPRRQCRHHRHRQHRRQRPRHRRHGRRVDGLQCRISQNTARSKPNIQSPTPVDDAEDALRRVVNAPTQDLLGRF